MRRVFLLLGVLFLAGCTNSVDVQLKPELVVFLSNDQQNTVPLSTQDSAYQELQGWLTENQDDWYVTNAAFAGGLYIQNDEQGIQVTRSHVVLYQKVGDAIEATHVQAISGAELSSVKALAQP